MGSSCGSHARAIWDLGLKKARPEGVVDGTHLTVPGGELPRYSMSEKYPGMARAHRLSRVRLRCFDHGDAPFSGSVFEQAGTEIALAAVRQEGGDDLSRRCQVHGGGVGGSEENADPAPPEVRRHMRTASSWVIRAISSGDLSGSRARNPPDAGARGCRGAPDNTGESSGSTPMR